MRNIKKIIIKFKVRVQYYLSKIYSKPLDIPYSYFEVDNECNTPQEKKLLAFYKDTGLNLFLDCRYNETMNYIEKLHNKKVITNSKYIQQIIKEEYS